MCSLYSNLQEHQEACATFCQKCFVSLSDFMTVVYIDDSSQDHIGPDDSSPDESNTDNSSQTTVV